MPKITPPPPKSPPLSPQKGTSHTPGGGRAPESGRAPSPGDPKPEKREKDPSQATTPHDLTATSSPESNNEIAEEKHCILTNSFINHVYLANQSRTRMSSYANVIIRNTEYCDGHDASAARPQHLSGGRTVDPSSTSAVCDRPSYSLDAVQLSAHPSQACILEDNNTLRYCNISCEASDTNSSPQPEQDLTCKVKPERQNRGKMLTFIFM